MHRTGIQPGNSLPLPIRPNEICSLLFLFSAFSSLLFTSFFTLSREKRFVDRANSGLNSAIRCSRMPARCRNLARARLSVEDTFHCQRCRASDENLKRQETVVTYSKRFCGLIDWRRLGGLSRCERSLGILLSLAAIHRWA